jgi:hypothetical protein
MTKEPYVKPEIKSEVLEPEALTGGGSGMGAGQGNGIPCPPGMCD